MSLVKCTFFFYYYFLVMLKEISFCKFQTNKLFIQAWKCDYLRAAKVSGRAFERFPWLEQEALVTPSDCGQ